MRVCTCLCISLGGGEQQEGVYGTGGCVVEGRLKAKTDCDVLTRTHTFTITYTQTCTTLMQPVLLPPLPAALCNTPPLTPL